MDFENVFGNIFGIKGEPIVTKRRSISEMESGEVGYTVEWAIKDGRLDEEFSIGEKGGTANVKVTCIKPGLYSIEYEEPVYRNIFEV